MPFTSKLFSQTILCPPLSKVVVSFLAASSYTVVTTLAVPPLTTLLPAVGRPAASHCVYVVVTVVPGVEVPTSWISLFCPS